MTDRGGEAGFSLVEMLVATVLLLVALAVAAQLLLESQYTYALAGREARDPMPGWALNRLRADVRGSSEVVSPALPAGLGSVGALTLSGHPTGTLRWERQGGLLVRTVLDPDTGEVLQRRTVLRRVTDWRWSRSGGLIGVAVSYRRHPRARIAGSPRLGAAATRVESVSLLLAQRGRPRRNRW